MARSYNVSFNITGAMDGSLLAAIRNAESSMRGLGNSARAASAAAKASQAGLQGLASSLNAIQAAAARYKNLQSAFSQTAADFNRQSQSIAAATQKYQQETQAVEQLRQKLSQLQTDLSKAKQNKILQSEGIKQTTADLQALKRAYDLAKLSGDKVSMASLSTQITQTQAALNQQRQAARQAAQAYKELSDKIKQTKTDLKSAEQAANESGRGLSRTRSEVERLKASLTQQFSALSQLKSQLAAAGFDTSNFAASEARLQSEINRTNAALERQAALMNARQRSQTASQDLTMSGANMMGAIYTAQQLASPFVSATEKAIAFQRQMSELKSISQMDLIQQGRMDEANANMAKLTAQAKELGATTIYTAQQVGEAQTYIARTGWDTEKIYRAMPPILKLAASQNMDVSRAADIATNVMTAFGHGIDQVEKDMDIFAYTVTHSNQNMEQFGEAMKYAAPVAKLFGATIEETAMMTKFAADAGIQGSMAGTSMRQTMLRLVSPPKKANKALSELGVTLDDANAAWQNAQAVAKEYGVTLQDNISPGRQFISVMEQLDKGMAGKSDQEKLAALSAITGINAVSGAANIFGAGAEQAKNFTELLENCRGALDQTYKVATDNAYGAQKSFESAWEAVQLSIGESLLGITRAGYEMFAPILTGISQFIDAHPGIVQACAAIAAALAGVIVSAAAVKLAFAGWSFVTAQIALVQAALSSLGSGAMLGGLLGRLAAIRTALFGLGGAATLSGWGAMFSLIAAKAAAARLAITGFFASLSLGSIASGVSAALSTVGTAIAGVARAAFAFAFSPVGAALMLLALAGMYCYQNWSKVAPVLSSIAGTITGALSNALTMIQPAIQNLMAAFEGLAGNGALQLLIDGLGKLATGALAAVASAIANILATVINVAATILSTIANIITGVVNLITSALNGDISGAFTAMGSIATSVLEGIGNVATTIFDGILTTVKSIGEAWSAITSKDAPSAPAIPSHGDNIHGGGGGSFGAPVQPIQPVQPVQPVQSVQPVETPQIDTSATQSALDAVGNSAQNAATNMDGVNQAATALGQLPTQIQPAADAFNQLPAAVQPAADGLNQMGSALPQVTAESQNLTSAMTANGSALQSNSSALQANIGALQSFGAACQGAVGSVEALGSAASGAAGSVSGLGAAAQSACAQLAAAGANAAASVNAAVASIPVKANYAGGIYRKGAFLTTFAERSPEAAIPLDNSARAKDLWTQAGQMLGILPQTQPTTFESQPPVNPEINLQEGNEISYRGRRDLPQRQQRQLPRIPKWAMATTQTMPRYSNDLGGNFSPTIINQPKESGGLLDGLLGGLLDSILPTPKSESIPAINLTVNVTIEGNADEKTVQRGIESALPAVDNWRKQLFDYQREQRRRSYS